jgi:SET domain
MGRLINHCRKPSVVSKVTFVDNVPHICLYASKKLTAGEQIVYNYGVLNLPFTDEVLVEFIFNLHTNLLIPSIYFGVIL